MEWHTVKKYPNYECSPDGQLRNKITGKILKGSLNKKGYREYCISENGIRHIIFGHRIVAEEFIPNPENKSQVNHIDGNKANNDISNLEWATPRENALHANRVIKTGPGGKNKKTVLCIETQKIYSSTLEAERETGIYNGFISSVCRGKKKSAHGYHFIYIDGPLVQQVSAPAS